MQTCSKRCELFHMNFIAVSLLQATEVVAPDVFGLGAFIGRIAFIIVMFALVAFAAYYTTRFISSSKRRVGSNNNIKVIEGAAVGPQANIQLVCVADKYFLIGVTKEKITFLSEVNGDAVNIPVPAKVFVPFETYLNKVFNKDVLKADDQRDEGDN